MSASAVVGKAETAAENVVRDVAPWLEKLARLGFLAKAVIYMTVGALASAAALRLGSTPATGSRGAMAKLLEAPFGHALLVVMAIGLFGYAAWRITEGIMDPQRAGHDAKGIAKRAQSIVLGGVHVALGITAIKLAWGDRGAGDDGANTQHWAAKALATPGGTTALWIVAAGFVAYGLHQIYCGWRAKLDKRLALGGMSAPAQRCVIGASRFGIAARGVVFATVGVLVARGARHHDPREARGVKQALLELLSFGRLPFILVATGLIAFGIYQLIDARYRRIDTV